MTTPLTISDAARDASFCEANRFHDEPQGHFAQLAINQEVEKATRELRNKIEQMELFHGDVLAGCDIQKGERLYRQVEVVFGIGLTKHEQQLTQWKAVAEKLASKYHEEMIMLFGHAKDCDCSRCEALTSYNNLLASETKGERK